MRQKTAWATVLFVLVSALSLPVRAEARTSSVSSQAVVLYEPQTGRFLYEKNADLLRPMASTTKLMTALIAAERLSADDVVTVPAEAVAVEGSSMGLHGGDVLTVRDLLAGLLLSSGNDAANVLALLIDGSLSAFAVSMNRRAAELGMADTLFVTPSGLDEGDHHSTAHDMALLGAAVLQVPLLAELCASVSTVVHVDGTAITLRNHNRLLQLYPDTIGLKTGYTKKSGKCLVSAVARNGVTLVIASLNGGDYWNDHVALYEYGFSLVESVALPVPTLPTVPVAGGVTEAVALRASEAQTVLLEGEAERVRYEWELPAFVWAPVEDRSIGTLRYYLGERLLAEVPLYATETVEARAAMTKSEIWQKRILELVFALTR